MTFSCGSIVKQQLIHLLYSTLTITYKVITTMVIRPLDDRTRYVQSMVADLQPLGLGYVASGIGAFGSSLIGSH